MGDETITTPGTCPVCGKPRVEKYRPFCSKRCADVDLGRWLGEVYTVPGSPLDEEDGDAMSHVPTRRIEEDQ